MFEKYFWAIEKLTHLRDESVYEVIQKVAVDFRQALETDQLNDIDFEYIKQFYQIANDPAAYYEDYLKNLYKVSVVMPIHNASKYLRQTLETVCEQSLREIEIILVENGSTDNTMDIINEFAVKIRELRGFLLAKVILDTQEMWAFRWHEDGICNFWMQMIILKRIYYKTLIIVHMIVQQIFCYLA